MEKTIPEFKFEIGDIVYFRTAINNGAYVPHPVVVVAQVSVYEQGGRCGKMYFVAMSGQAVLVHELELTRYKPGFETLSNEEIDQIARARGHVNNEETK